MRFKGNPVVLSVMVLAVGGVVACSGTPAELESRVAPITRDFSENYQEIYRRVSRTATRCWGSARTPYSSLDVDSQLYSELGFGEVAFSQSNMGARTYFVTARVERRDEGSRLILHSGNTLASQRHAATFLRWSDGDEAC